MVEPSGSVCCRVGGWQPPINSGVATRSDDVILINGLLLLQAKGISFNLCLLRKR